MIAEIGYFALILALVVAIYAIIASVYGERKRIESLVLSGRNAALLNFVFVTIATGALQLALMTEQYGCGYFVF
jgi:cytochrome c-type biogenesis protein CcmF